MKRRVFFAIVAACLLGGCVGESNYVIQVNGDSGFSGSVLVTRAGKVEQRSVEGKAPQSYNEAGSGVSVTFQKKDAAGRLEVEIFKDGRSIGKQSTTAEYGVVSVAGQ